MVSLMFHFSNEFPSFFQNVILRDFSVVFFSKDKRLNDANKCFFKAHLKKMELTSVVYIEIDPLPTCLLVKDTCMHLF